MYPFDYIAATSVEEAIAAVAGKGKNTGTGTEGDAKFLAGGMTMIPVLKQRLARVRLLVDISRIEEIATIRQESTDIVVGSAVIHDRVARDPEVGRSIPALATLAGLIGDPQVRNRGTLGGAIANNDPAADYPAALVGLGATVVTSRRRIAADAYFRGMFETPLAADELIREVSFPVPHRAAYVKFRVPSSRYGLVGVFVARTPAGVRVAVTGAGPCVFRHLGMEEALEERFAPETARRVPTGAEGLISDIHGSADYRAHLIAVATARAVEAAG